MPLALIALAVALAANVLLGPLGVGALQWRVSSNALNQTYGADAASLLLVVPAALAAAPLALVVLTARLFAPYHSHAPAATGGPRI